MLCFLLCWIFIQHSQSVYTLLERRVVASEFMPKSHFKSRVSLEDMQMKVLQIYLRFNYVLREHRFHFVDFEKCGECEKHSYPNVPDCVWVVLGENPIFICSTSSSSDGSELCGIFGKRLMCIFFEFNLCDWNWIDSHKEKESTFSNHSKRICQSWNSFMFRLANCESFEGFTDVLRKKFSYSSQRRLHAHTISLSSISSALSLPLFCRIS